MKKNVKTAVLFGCLIFLAALVGLPTAHGYLHPADPLILLAGMLLPTPHAMISVGLASLLADLGKGYYLLAPVTMVIKVLTVWAVKGLLKTKPAQKFPEVMVSLAALIPIPAYYLTELIYQLCTGGKLQAFATAAVTLRKDSVQAVASMLLFILIYDIYKGIKAGREEIRRLKAEKEEAPKE